jgi:hypothetical protein
VALICFTSGSACKEMLIQEEGTQYRRLSCNWMTSEEGRGDWKLDCSSMNRSEQVFVTGAASVLGLRPATGVRKMFHYSIGESSKLQNNY